MTPVEDNFPVKMQLPQESIEKLLTENDFVFGSFANQVKDTIEQLTSNQVQEQKIFEDQDLIITQNCQISSYLIKDSDGNDITTVQMIPPHSEEEEVQPITQKLFQIHRSFNILGLLHSKKARDPAHYQQLLFKFMKLVELELESSNKSQPILVIPLDFLTLLNITEEDELS